MHKNIGITQYVLLGMATLLTASTAALADTTTLICNYNDGIYISDEPTTIVMNEAQSSVVVNFGAFSLAAPHVRVSGGSRGPLRAVFGTDAVTFTIPVMRQPPWPAGGSITINRLSGIMKLMDTDSNLAQWQCRVGQKQF